jgi:hypothetical protein
MNYATASASSYAKGVYAMCNLFSKSNITPNDDLSTTDLSSMDDAEGVRDLLLQYISKVLVLKFKSGCFRKLFLCYHLNIIY